MKVAHEIRGRLHTARLHVTFLERACSDHTPDVVEAVMAAADELRQLERVLLALLALSQDQ